MNITMDILDAAQYYIAQTGCLTFRWEKGNPALRLAVAIRSSRKVGHLVCKTIADEALAKVAKLMA